MKVEQTPMMLALTHIGITIEEHERLKLAEKHGNMLRRAYDLCLQEKKQLIDEHERIKKEAEKYKNSAVTLLNRLKEERRILCDEIEFWVKENAKLKKLDENVNKKIELIKSTIENVGDQDLGVFYIVKAILMVLENLRND